MDFWEELVQESRKGTMGESLPDSVCSFAKEIPSEVVIGKPAFDGFYNTNLEEILHQWNVKHVYLAGMITSCCVFLTGASAFIRGFKVNLIHDCCADRTQEKQNTIIDIYGKYMFYSRSLAQIQEM